MAWFNPFGLAFVAVLMIPNLIFAAKCRDGFENAPTLPKWLLVLEQIGRFGCFAFMIFNVPGTCFGWPSNEAFAAYLIADGLLAALYCLIWFVCFRKSSVFRALALSIIPSLLFLLSGIMSRSILLTIAAVIFAPSHILLSYKNAQ